MKTCSLLSCFVIGVLIPLATSGGGKRSVCWFIDPDTLMYLNNAVSLVTFCTDIILEWVHMRADSWELVCSWRDYDRMHDFRKRYSRSEKPPKFFLTFRPHDESEWTKMAADPSKRMLFINSVLQYIEVRGYNGLNLEWYRPGPSDRENYVKLVEELVERKPAHVMLTGTVKLDDAPYYTPRNLSGFNFQRLSQLFDWINVEPMINSGGDHVDLPSPLFRREFDYKNGEQLNNMHDRLEIIVQQGAPRHKLMFGISLGGVLYKLPRNDSALIPINYALKAPAIHSVIMMYEMYCKWSSDKFEKRFDVDGMSPYAYHDDQWMGYDDERSIRLKMQYVKDRGYGGAYVTFLEADDYRSDCGPEFPLLHAVHSALQDNKRPEPGVDQDEEIVCKRYQALGIPIPKCPSG